MGANFSVCYTKKDKSELHGLYDSLVEDARQEYGSGGYSGTIAESRGFDIWEQDTFDSVSAAREWLSDKTDKWGPTVAVRIESEQFTGWALGGWYSE